MMQHAVYINDDYREGNHIYLQLVLLTKTKVIKVMKNKMPEFSEGSIWRRFRAWRIVMLFNLRFIIFSYLI